MGESAGETLRSIGEQGLLQRLKRFCPEGVMGDDGAVLTVTPDRSLVVTTDVLVDGVHFSVGLANPIVTTPPHSAGFRAVAANLSDLAAMGARPIGITIGLSLPPEIPVAWIESLYEGMVDCLGGIRGGVPIVGGDVVRSSVFSLAITAFGEGVPDRVVRRSAARVGDVIVMTGVHGRSRVGLELLLGHELGLSEAVRSVCIHAHQYPKPRLDVLPFLPFPCPAGMDSSDGLADAVVQIARASGVGAQLEGRAIFQHPEVMELCVAIGVEKAIDWVLYGGEDFELVLCMAADAAVRFCELTGSYSIGRVTDGGEVWLVDGPDGGGPRRLGIDGGFRHFDL